MQIFAAVPQNNILALHRIWLHEQPQEQGARLIHDSCSSPLVSPLRVVSSKLCGGFAPPPLKSPHIEARSHARLRYASSCSSCIAKAALATPSRLCDVAQTCKAPPHHLARAIAAQRCRSPPTLHFEIKRPSFKPVAMSCVKLIPELFTTCAATPCARLCDLVAVSGDETSRAPARVTSASRLVGTFI